jgi:hypothetical protein
MFSCGRIVVPTVILGGKDLKIGACFSASVKVFLAFGAGSWDIWG